MSFSAFHFSGRISLIFYLFFARRHLCNHFPAKRQNLIVKRFRGGGRTKGVDIKLHRCTSSKYVSRYLAQFISVKSGASPQMNGFPLLFVGLEKESRYQGPFLCHLSIHTLVGFRCQRETDPAETFLSDTKKNAFFLLAIGGAFR